MTYIGNDWDSILKTEFTGDYYMNLEKYLLAEYKNHTIYPPANDIFRALVLTSYQDTKAVILGQDPYHRPGQAHGPAFSVKPGAPIPPSLRNIYKELENDTGITHQGSGCLEHWAKQGVLLLNTVLTVREGCPGSHAGKGWEIFTDKIISELNNKTEPVVFLLWGKYANGKKGLISNPVHYILTASHPCPMSASRGFFGCGHFSETNRLLKKNGKSPIRWELP